MDLDCKIGTCRKRFHFGSDVVKHIKAHIRSGHTVKCPVTDCKRYYRVVSSFAAHISRCHSTITRCNDTGAESDHGEMQEDVLEEDGAGTSDQISATDFVSSSSTKSVSLLMQSYMFWMELEYLHLIPTSTVDHVIKELSNLLKLHKKQTLEDAREYLSCHNIDLGSVNAAFDLSTYNSNSSDWLPQSSKQRKLFVQQHLPCVEPVEYRIVSLLGSSQKSKTYCYIPVVKTLKSLFQNDTVKNQFFNPEPYSPAGVYCDLKDGAVFKNNALLQQNNSINLILYQDSFEIVNPLGSARKKHKLLAFYFTLGNMWRQCRSKIDHMQLVLLCKEKYVNEDNVDTILQPLIEDLKMLEREGIEIGEKKVRACVLCITGDNLGSNWLGGFVTNFGNAHYVCRYCEAPREKFLSSGDDASSLRSVSRYDAALRCTSTSGNVMGIKRNSIFNSLDFFHVCSPGLPPCIAHDLFEGVVATDVMLIIRYFTASRWFSEDDINRRILDFPYLKTDAISKPVPIKTTATRLVGNASQNWCFLRLFPLLVYDKVKDTSNPVWEMLLVLRTVVERVCAPVLDNDDIAMLSLAVDEYLCIRRQCFPDAAIYPKHHFMTHYAYLVTQFGPLANLSTLRFEGKHSYFKRVVQRKKNFKNVAFMLLRNHQMRQAFLLNSRYYDDDLIYDEQDSFPVSRDVHNALGDLFEKDCNIIKKNKV